MSSTTNKAKTETTEKRLSNNQFDGPAINPSPSVHTNEKGENREKSGEGLILPRQTHAPTFNRSRPREVREPLIKVRLLVGYPFHAFDGRYGIGAIKFVTCIGYTMLHNTRDVYLASSLPTRCIATTSAYENCLLLFADYRTGPYRAIS